MNVVQCLLDDHKRIRGLFRQLEGIRFRAPSLKAGVCREILAELEVHTEIEERFIYPTAGAPENQNLEALASKLAEDHLGMRNQIQLLRALAEDTARFQAAMNDLIEEVELHIAEEEADFFPKAQDTLNSKEGLLETILNVRKTLLEEPQFANASPEVVQNPNGGEQRRQKRTAA